jgi:hypothetical protein
VAVAEAVAEVACVLTAVGPFLAVAMLAGDGRLDNCRAVHFEDCVSARAALLAGFERSMLMERRGGREDKEEREEGGKVVYMTTPE